MKDFAFRQYRRLSKDNKGGNKPESTEPQDKESATYQKRREQVRRAQRTHRERKENYTRNLESQVLRLLSSETALTHQNNHLEREVDRLKKLLEQNSIPYSSTLNSSSSLGVADSELAQSVSTISILPSPLGAQQLHVGGLSGNGRLWLTGGEEIQVSQGNATSHGWSSLSRINQQGSEGGSSMQNTDQAGMTATTQKIRDLDQTDLALEFVLTLEALCLDHIQTPGYSSQNQELVPTGHALMASAAILEESPTQPVDITSNTQWNMPRLGLENLLELSQKIDFNGDLAPVQAWARLCERSGFEELELGQLRALTQDLLKEMKCHGFGSVIDSEVFERLVDKVLPWQRPVQQ